MPTLQEQEEIDLTIELVNCHQQCTELRVALAKIRNEADELIKICDQVLTGEKH
jgi:hypothetical protein